MSKGKKILFAVIIFIVITAIVVISIYITRKNKEASGNDGYDKSLIDKLKNEVASLKAKITSKKDEKDPELEIVKDEEPNAFAGDSVSPLNVLEMYSSYGVVAKSIYTPGYPLGVLIDTNGASDFYTIRTPQNEILQTRKVLTKIS